MTVRKIRRMLTGRASIMTIRIIRSPLMRDTQQQTVGRVRSRHGLVCPRDCGPGDIPGSPIADQRNGLNEVLPRRPSQIESGE